MTGQHRGLGGLLAAVSEDREPWTGSDSTKLDPVTGVSKGRQRMEEEECPTAATREEVGDTEGGGEEGDREGSGRRPAG